MRRMTSFAVPVVAVLTALPFVTLGPLGSRVVSAHGAPEIVEVIVLEPPGAVSSVARGINAAGDLTGEYRDANGRTHGWFLGKNEDVYTTLDYPISTSTVAQGINSRGDIVGFFNDPITRIVRGWLRSVRTTASGDSSNNSSKWAVCLSSSSSICRCLVMSPRRSC